MSKIRITEWTISKLTRDLRNRERSKNALRGMTLGIRSVWTIKITHSSSSHGIFKAATKASELSVQNMMHSQETSS